MGLDSLGRAVLEGVERIRCTHDNGFAHCPIEPTIGAFIALGELDRHARQIDIEVTASDGKHRLVEQLAGPPAR